jgi:hypothetical protein
MGNVRAGNPNRALIIAARIALTRPDFPNQNVNGPRPIVGSFPWKRPVLPSARGQFLDDGASGNYPPDSLISIIIGSHPVNFPESESWPRHVDLSARRHLGHPTPSRLEAKREPTTFAARHDLSKREPGDQLALTRWRRDGGGIDPPEAAGPVLPVSGA